MTRFADTLIGATDSARIRKIHQDEATRFAAQFAPSQAKAAANAKAFTAKRTFALA